MNKTLEIHFVSGKGGVGKSVVAAALATALHSRGKKTLLVELGNQSFYRDFFGLTHVGYSPSFLRKGGPDLAIWSGQECLREYARHLLKLEALYRLFFENPVSRALVNVAPGLPELSIMGKITSGPPRNVGPQLDYDCLVIDAYASGHFLALLRAPRGMAEAISFGPMGEQSRGIDAVLKNPQICKYYIVSIPEELPIQEACELSAEITSLTGISPTQIFNKTQPLGGRTLTAALQGASETFRAVINEKYLEQLRFLQQLEKYKVIEVPFILSHLPWAVVDGIAGGLHV